MTPKLLIGIPSPRDIPEFLEATAKLEYDKIWSKYRTEYPAFKKIREFFLEHPEYSHLAILCDDLIVKPDDVKRLFHVTVVNDYPALGGLCMVNRDEEWKDCVNLVTTQPVNPHRPERHYDFITVSQWQTLLNERDTIQTKFQGFPFTIIRRDIVEQFEFKTDGFYNNKPERGCCTDTVFCWELFNAGIHMYADLRIFMHHIPDSRYLTNKVGQTEPYEYFETPKLKGEDLLEHEIEKMF